MVEVAAQIRNDIWLRMLSIACMYESAAYVNDRTTVV